MASATSNVVIPCDFKECLRGPCRAVAKGGGGCGGVTPSPHTARVAVGTNAPAEKKRGGREKKGEKKKREEKKEKKKKKKRKKEKKKKEKEEKVRKT